MVRPGLDHAEAQARLARWVESLPAHIAELEAAVGQPLPLDRSGLLVAWAWARTRLSRATTRPSGPPGDDVPEWARQPWHEDARAYYSTDTLQLITRLAALHGESVRLRASALEWGIYETETDTTLEDGDVALITPEDLRGELWATVWPLRDVQVLATRAIERPSTDDDLARTFDMRLAAVASVADGTADAGDPVAEPMHVTDLFDVVDGPVSGPLWRRRRAFRVALGFEVTPAWEPVVERLERELPQCPGVESAEWGQEESVFVDGTADGDTLRAWLTDWFERNRVS